MEFQIWNSFALDIRSGKIEVMQITVDRRPLEQVEADALIVPVFEGRKRIGSAPPICSTRGR